MAEIYSVKTFDQIYNAMKQYLIGKSSLLSNFNDGGRVNTILEAVGFVASSCQEDFFQALKKAIPVAVYEGWEYTKKVGYKSQGKLQFARTTNATEVYPIAVGTSIRLNNILYTTIEAGSIAIGAKISGEISSESERVGLDTNLSINAINTLSGLGSFINQPVGIQSCSNPVAFTGGTDTETDKERQARFRYYVRSLAKAPLSGILSGVRSIEGIKSATVLENTPSNGWLTVYADDGTGTLSETKRLEIVKIIEGDVNDFENYPGYKAAGIYVQVLAPSLLLIDIEASLLIKDASSLTNTEIELIAKTEIQNYTNTLRINQDWVKSEAITIVQNADDDIYDFTIEVPIADIVAVASGQLAKTNTITITVNRITEDEVIV